MYQYTMTSKQSATANCAAAASFCANLSVILDAALLASIIFILMIMGLHILGILVVMLGILRIMMSPKKSTCV